MAYLHWVNLETAIASQRLTPYWAARTPARGKTATLLALLTMISACGDGISEPDCSDERCDEVGSRDELVAALEGHADPIADMLRNLSTASGTLTGDYNQLLDELGDIVGCDASTERGFVVLSNADFIPKTVFARCADSPQQASRFFVAAPALNGDDMEPQTLHLSGWDEDAGQYRHYATAPTASGGMSINVEPSFCLGCHGGPEQLTEWQPLMNEMTNPWSGWNAEPGFRSQLFDELLDQSVAQGAVYSEMLSTTRLDSASNLEPLIRAGISRTVGARVLTRNDLAETSAALDLIRPLFCDETVNYVSEVHDSGELRLDAVVDESLRKIVAGLVPEAEWSWRGESTTLLPILADDEEPVTLIATRATISVEIEQALLARNVLDGLELLRARALDWQRPFDSDERCELYRSGRARIESGALADEVSALPTDATSEALIPLFYNEILREHPRGTLADARALGDEISAVVAGLSSQDARDQLRELRDQRGCSAKERFAGAPIIPSLQCP